jgi:hypothetical protein
VKVETLMILDARDLGVLPASITLNVSRTNVAASMPRYGPVDFAAQERAVAWFREAFGEVEERRSRWCAYRGSRGHGAADQVDYRAKTDAGLVQLFTFAPHEHGDFYGEVRNGKPRWVCRGCRKPITKTEARRLGLLPA